MSGPDDEADARELSWCLDLASLVSDVRHDRPESLPRDSRFALALVLLASRFDEDELAELLAVPEEIVEGAARHLHSEVRHELIVRNLRDAITAAWKMKENNQ
jgi:hypothetical protein